MAAPLLACVAASPHVRGSRQAGSKGGIVASMIGRFVAGGAIPVVGIALFMATPQVRDSSSRSTLAAFDQRIAEYAALHRRLEARLPPLEVSTDPDRFITHRKKLVAAIRTARPKASQGDFFDPAVAPVFRHLVEEALYGLDVERLLRDLFEEHPRTWGYRVSVYDSYPSWATREVPALLLQQLPELPEELEYRVVDHDLAILDVDANLVLDVLPAAIAHVS